MEHKKHISNIIKLGISGLILCLLILGYSFLLNISSGDLKPIIDRENTITNNHYKNEKYGFQLIVPDNWIESPGNAYMNFAILENNLKGEFPVYVSGNYVIKDDLAEIGFDRVVESSKKLYLETLEKGTFLSDEKITINGLEARLIKIRAQKYDSEGKNIEDVIDYELLINTGINNGIYVFLGGYRESLGIEYDKKIFNILTSFKVIPVKPTVYKSEEFGFEMIVPNTWAESEKDENMDFAFHDKTISKFNFIQGTHINEGDLEGMSFDEFVDNAKQLHKDPVMASEVNADVVILSDEKIKVDNQESRMVKMNTKNYTGNGKKEFLLYTDYLLFIKKEKGVQVTAGSYKDSLAYKYDKIVLDSLLSFKFIK